MVKAYHSFFCVCFSGQRGTIALKLDFTYEKHLSVGRSSDRKRARSLDPPACLLLPRAILHSLLFGYSQLNTGVSYFVDYVEDIYDDGGPLCPCFNP